MERKLTGLLRGYWSVHAAWPTSLEDLLGDITSTEREILEDELLPELKERRARYRKLIKDMKKDLPSGPFWQKAIRDFEETFGSLLEKAKGETLARHVQALTEELQESPA